MGIIWDVLAKASDKDLADIMRASADDVLARMFRQLPGQMQFAVAVAADDKNNERADPPTPPAPPKPRKPRSTKDAARNLDSAVLDRFSPGATRATVELSREVGEDARRACVRLAKAGMIVSAGRGVWRMPDAKDGAS